MKIEAEIRLLGYAGALVGVVVVTLTFTRFVNAVNSTTVALAYLLVVLLVASARGLGPSILASIASMLCFNYFFLPPVHALTIQDPQNWVALSAFLFTAAVASKLSSAARDRAEEADRRREEVWRLYQLSRAIIATPDTETATSSLALEVLEVFSLDYFGVFLPAAEAGWQALAESGQLSETSRAARDSEISKAFESTNSRIVPDEEAGLDVDGGLTAYVPLKIGVRPTGVAVLQMRSPIDSRTVEAVGGLIALALERARFLKQVSQTEALRQSDELKSALLASVSHDLRTPLTSIRTAIDSILQQGLSWDQAALNELHQIIGEEVQRLTGLVDNLLEMARIEAGELKVSRDWVPVSEIITSVLQRASRTLRAHHVETKYDDTLLVKVDWLLVAEALANLLENAAKYSPSQSKIVVRAEYDGNNLAISVADRGPGVAREEADRLFEKFYRGRESGRATKPGTGMGLAIVRGIVQAHGGSVWVKPHEGGGAVFGFSLPVEAKPMNAAYPQDEQNPIASTANTRKR